MTITQFDVYSVNEPPPSGVAALADHPCCTGPTRGHSVIMALTWFPLFLRVPSADVTFYSRRFYFIHTYVKDLALFFQTYSTYFSTSRIFLHFAVSVLKPAHI